MKLRACIGLLLALLVLVPTPAARAGGTLTLDEVFAKEPPWGRMPSRVVWAPGGGKFLYVLPGQDPDEALALRLYDVAAGTSRVWATAAAFGAKRTPAVLGWSPDGAQVAVLAGGSLYVADAKTARAREIAADVDDARWSPRGGALAYARHADLYVASLGAKIQTRRLTRGGVDGDVLDGTLDWVYPEELGIERGFAWSADGSRIAYLRLDERPVTNFPIVDFLKPDNSVDDERYPLAGERNPRASLREVDLATGADRLVYDAGKRDEYVAAFDWLPRSRTLEAEILDRRQRALRVDLWPGAAGAARTVYAQHSSTWVDVVPLPVWLPGGRSVWLLDRDTTAGVFIRAADGVLRKLTGNYHVDAPFEVDAAHGVAYARAAYPTRRDASLLAIPLGGGEPANLTPAPGSHRVVLSPAFDRFLDVHDTANDPPQADLVTVATQSATTLAPQNAALKARLATVKLLEVPSQYGALDATMLEPPDFDATKKYPVVVYVYGGPAAPTTQNGGFGQLSLYHQLLARAGFIVFSIDGPASQVDDDAHVRLLLHAFGPGSLLGQEIGAKYLATLPFVDPARIGIWGWSFGGYETTYAMTHSTLFKAGAAVAPVTDWHLYDSIYTERYMGLPQEDPKAYAASSVLGSAGSLHGPLLIQHGTSDDNVHLANTIQLLQQFILANQTRVQFFPYPRKTHSITGLAQRRSVFARMLEFWRENL